MNRPQLKMQAKDIMSKAKPSPLLASVVYVVLLLIISLLSAKLLYNGFDNDTILNMSNMLMEGDYDSFMNYMYLHMPTGTQTFLDALLEILGIIVGVGFTIFTLNTVKGAEATLWNLLDGFGMFLRILWLYVLEIVFIALWSLLLFFPGIIAFYRYRMAIYLLIEHPEMSVMQCIRESKRMMRGHKAELFILDLSFILWQLVLSVPYLGWIAKVYYTPYYYITIALYYKQLSGSLAYYQADWSPEL